MRLIERRIFETNKRVRPCLIVGIFIINQYGSYELSIFCNQKTLCEIGEDRINIGKNRGGEADMIKIRIMEGVSDG